MAFLLGIAGCGCSKDETKDSGAQTSDEPGSAIDALTGNESDPDINWVIVPSGEFTFGSPEDTPCRAPIPETQFNVKLTRPFVIAETEITQAQWRSLDFPNPSQNIGDDKPVTFVNFFEAMGWCNRLSKTNGFDTCYDLSNCKNQWSNGCDEGKEGDTDSCWEETYNFNCKSRLHKYEDRYSCPGYRLPTTAEWEYAAKAGTTEHTYNGDVHYVPLSYCEEEPALEDIAWYCHNSGNELHAVKLKNPNPWGLYDMLGNVYEWTDYYFHGNSLSDGGETDLTDPVGPQTGTTVEIRGGVFSQTGCYVRPSRTTYFWPVSRVHNFGFRPVRTLFGDEADEANSADSPDSESE